MKENKKVRNVLQKYMQWPVVLSALVLCANGAGLALRPPAHVTHLFIAVFFLLFVFIFTMAGCLHILGILFFVQVSSPLC